MFPLLESDVVEVAGPCAVERLACVFYLLFFISCAENHWKFSCLTSNLWGNVSCKYGAPLLRTTTTTARSFPHCVVGWAVWFTEMWSTSQVGTWQTSASSCLIRHCCDRRFASLGLDVLGKLFKNEEKKNPVARLRFLVPSAEVDLLKLSLV